MKQSGSMLSWSLHLDNNNLGPDGARAIGEALKMNVSIKYLNLWNNGLGPDGAVAIGEALKVNQALMQLDLSGSNLGPRGARD